MSYLLRFTVLHVRIAVQGSSVCVCISILIICQWNVHEAVYKRDQISDKTVHSGFIFASYTYILLLLAITTKQLMQLTKNCLNWWPKGRRPGTAHSELSAWGWKNSIKKCNACCSIPYGSAASHDIRCTILKSTTWPYRFTRSPRKYRSQRRWCPGSIQTIGIRYNV